MNRWWDDPDSARQILAVVGPDDVIQGVGSAVLGYHALAKEALAPLASTTLVDLDQMSAALGSLDLTPVAQALAAATRPVMGEASDKYGELLAGQIHADAVEGVHQAVRVWSSQGVPMPAAVERAADVVGVPARRIGTYAQQVKSVAVQPMARSDAADRALMEYASHVGRRESDGEIAKAIKVRFREEDHPRDDDGKFALKNTQAEADERLARIRRIGDVVAVGNKQRKERTLAQLASEVVLPPTATPKPKRPIQRQFKRTFARPVPTEIAVVSRPSLRAVDETTPTKRPKTSEASIQNIRESVIMLPRDMVLRAIKNGLLIDGPDREFSGLDEFLEDQDTWSKVGQGLVAVVIDGNVPIEDGTPPGDDFRHGKDMTFTVPTDARFTYRGKSMAFVEPDPSLSGAAPIPVETYYFGHEKSDDALQSWLHGGKKKPGKGVSKALERWNVRGKAVNVEVERDTEGKFSEVDERTQRLERLSRIQSVIDQSNKAKQAVQATTAEPVAETVPRPVVRQFSRPVVRQFSRPVVRQPLSQIAPKESRATPRRQGATKTKEQTKFSTMTATIFTESDFARLFDALPGDLVDGGPLQGVEGSVKEIRSHSFGGAENIIRDQAFTGDSSAPVADELGAEVFSSYKDAEILADRLNADEFANVFPEARSGRYVISDSDRGRPGDLEVHRVEYDPDKVTIVGDLKAIMDMRAGKRVHVERVYPDTDGLLGLMDDYGSERDRDKIPTYLSSVVVVRQIDY